MTVRTVVPHRVKVAGRRASVRIGSVTATRRQLPSFIVVGAQRAGTTSLFRALMSHPLIHSANFYKGVNYFDVNYYRDFSWYQGHFPTTSYLRSRSRSVPGEPITFEASGYYLFHPGAAERIARHLPEVRILAMLRDPVERAFSAYKHELARGFETESFERALDLEDERLHGQGDRMLADDRYRSFSHRHHGYVHRGQYAEQLARMRRHFPADQIHVLDSESFFEQPETTYGAVLDFLGLPQVLPAAFDRWNARPSSPMAESTRARLREHFLGRDRALAEMLGRDPAWLS
jgi:Sulfotransferase domain